MGLKIIYGRAGSGKSTYCAHLMKEFIEKNENPLAKAYLIVPEQFTVEGERRLIQIFGTGGLLKTEVVSFKRLAHRVLSTAGGITYPHLNNAGKSMILSSIVREFKDELKYFSSILKHNGFVSEVLGLIREFKRYKVTHQTISEFSQKVGFSDKLRELAILYREYERKIAFQFRDADDDLSLMARKMYKTDLFSNAAIWIDEFNGFTPQEYAVITSLLERAEQVNISLCMDEAIEEDSDFADVFSPVKESFNRLMKIARRMGAVIHPPEGPDINLLPRFLENRELRHLEANYFTFPNAKFTEELKAIDIYSAPNIYAEIEQVAGQIVLLCRDRGYRFRDMAVVTRELPSYEKIIEVIFRTYDIPHFIDRKREVTDNPLIRMISSLFDIVKGNWSYESVFSCLKSGFFDLEREALDLLQNYVLATGIKGSLWTMEGDWRHSSSFFGEEREEEYTEEILKEINTTRRRVVEPILAFCQKARGKRPAAQICEALYEFLVTLDIPDGLERMIEKLKEEGELQLANEYTQVFHLILEVMDQMVVLFQEELFTFDRFSQTFMTALSQYKIGTIPPSLDRVHVGSIDRSRSHGVKVLFVVGTNDGVFPSTNFSEGILSDKERNVLKKEGLLLADDSKAKAFAEQFLIYRTLTTPRDGLKLSYPMADLEGRAMRPSMIVGRLRRIFPNLSPRSGIVEEAFGLHKVSSRLPSLNHLISILRKDGIRMQKANEVLDVFAWFLGRNEWKSYLERVFSGLTYTNSPGHFSGAVSEKLYGKPIYTSISRFERYTMCPFSYFVQYGIKAKERKMMKMSSPDIGNLLHLVLEKFSKKLIDAGLSFREYSEEWSKGAVLEIQEELLQKMKGAGSGASHRNLYLAKRLNRVVSRAIKVVTTQIRQSEFDPLGFEMVFSNHGDFPAVEIQVPGKEKVLLTGKIDRVDIHETEAGTYVRIVDYKSGQKKWSLSDVYHGLSLQLLSYLDAICQVGVEGRQGPMLPGGIFYLKLDDPLIKGKLHLTDEVVQTEILKKLKMNGLLLAEVSLVKKMDTAINGPSILIPARMNNGDVLGQSSAVSLERFELLRNYVKKLLSDIAGKILEGQIGITPWKNKLDTACKFCKYISVCQFDPKLPDNRYRNVDKKSNEEIFRLMEGDVQ